MIQKREKIYISIKIQGLHGVKVIKFAKNTIFGGFLAFDVKKYKFFIKIMIITSIFMFFCIKKSYSL